MADPITAIILGLGGLWLYHALKKRNGGVRPAQPAYYDFQEMGIQACEDGRPLDECPFPSGTSACNDWCEGWMLTYEVMHGKAALDEYMRKWGYLND